MYRAYENPAALQKMLEDAERRLSDAQAAGDYDCYDLFMDVEELRDRANFAWQDDEYDEMYG